MSIISVTAFTDGGCRGNPGGIGGWGAILINNITGTALERWGAERDTTNNRMELLAAIEALRALKQPGMRVTLHSDSQYVIKGISEWLPGWKARGWRTASKGPVLNRDLWELLDALNAAQAVNWRWVKGHAGDRGNERVDLLANQAMDALRDGRPSSGERRCVWAAPAA